MPKPAVVLPSVRSWGAVALLVAVLLAGCGSDAADGAPGSDVAEGTVPDSAASDLSGADVAPPEDLAAGPDVPPPPPAVGTCAYTNPFSRGSECKAYTGPAWTAESAAADCTAVLPGTAGTFAAGGTCGFAAELGRCLVASDEGEDYVLVSAGEDDTACGAAKAGCEVFAGGTFAPGGTCEGTVTPPPDGGYGDEPFVQPYEACRDPLPGEPAGQREGGKVCGWTMISGCVEMGRRFDDYASCEDVLTQRPYWAAPNTPETPADDPRLSDVTYMDNVAWARQQVEACGCICCHSTRTAPDGPSGWYVEAGPIWLDSVADSGLSMMAGLSASDALGAYPAAENNGFDRTALGLPTTDIERMRAFLLGEWQRRGFTPEDGAAYPAFGGPIVDQQRYAPTACAAGVGIASDGTISWEGGAARYLYVLPVGAANPGVPPNLDEPEGTLWLVDVATADEPFATGVRYGQLAGDLRQRLPESGAPPALVAGTTYYLYVLRDIGFPLARCLFTY